jgi:hypothetical protein
MVLFPHDNRMVAAAGEEAYVRWMDDQNFGAASRAGGLRILTQVGKSLARLHLTPNTAKSKLLSLKEARRHFHLDLNHMLDRAQARKADTTRHRRELRRELSRIWAASKQHEGKGEWEKILRLYLLAGRAQSRMLRGRAYVDLIRYPELAARLADYVRWTGSATEYIALSRRAWNDAEQVYEDVNVTLFERLLLLETDANQSAEIRRIGSELLSGKMKLQVGGELCAAVAPLLLLRFGDRRSRPSLRRCFDGTRDKASERTVRSAAIVYASYGIDEFREVRRAAARLWKHQLADMVRLAERIMKYEKVPDRFKLRLKPFQDSSLGKQYIDMRNLLAVRLLCLNRRSRVVAWLRDERRKLLQAGLSPFDKALVGRLFRPR